MVPMYMIPLPNPAQKSIAIQLNVENSGSPSPSFIFPYLLKASHPKKTNTAIAAHKKSHPKLVVVKENN